MLPGSQESAGRRVSHISCGAVELPYRSGADMTQSREALHVDCESGQALSSLWLVKSERYLASDFVHILQWRRPNRKSEFRCEPGLIKIVPSSPSYDAGETF